MFATRKFVRDSIVAILGFGYALWAMYATGTESIAKGFLLLMAGIPVYLFMKWQGQRDRIPMRSELDEPEVDNPLTLEELDHDVERLRTRTAI